MLDDHRASAGAPYPSIRSFPAMQSSIPRFAMRSVPPSIPSRRSTDRKARATDGTLELAGVVRPVTVLLTPSGCGRRRRRRVTRDRSPRLLHRPEGCGSGVEIAEIARFPVGANAVLAGALLGRRIEAVLLRRSISELRSSRAGVPPRTGCRRRGKSFRDQPPLDTPSSCSLHVNAPSLAGPCAFAGSNASARMSPPPPHRHHAGHASPAGGHAGPVRAPERHDELGEKPHPLHSNDVRMAGELRRQRRDVLATAPTDGPDHIETARDIPTLAAEFARRYGHRSNGGVRLSPELIGALGRADGRHCPPLENAWPAGGDERRRDIRADAFEPANAQGPASEGAVDVEGAARTRSSGG